MSLLSKKSIGSSPVCPSKAPRDDNDDDAIEFRCRCPPPQAPLTKQDPVGRVLLSKSQSSAQRRRCPRCDWLPLRRRRGSVWRGGGLRTFLFKPDISGGGCYGGLRGREKRCHHGLSLHGGIIGPAMPSLSPSLPSEKRRLAN